MYSSFSQARTVENEGILIKSDVSFSKLRKKIQMKGPLYGSCSTVTSAGRQDVLFIIGLVFNFYIFFLWKNENKSQNFN